MSGDVAQKDEDISPELKRKCDEWINVSAFFARLIANGIDQKYEPSCKYPSFDIPGGLEKVIPNQIVRDCNVMVAAQYILIAGPGIYENFIIQPKGSERGQWGLDKWPLWARKFKEVAEKGDLSSDVQAAALEARAVMVSLHPDPFATGVPASDIEAERDSGLCDE